MTVTLVMTNAIAADLAAAAADRVETAGVLLVSVLETACGNVRLLARELLWASDGAYARREADGLSVGSVGYVHSLGRAELIGATAIWVHTHPGQGAVPLTSKADDIVDRELAELFRQRSGSSYYGALIVSPGMSGFAFSGHIQQEAGPRLPISRAWSVGDRLRLTASFESRALDLSAEFDRNVRAFGAAIQETLGSLHVGVIGCGGTGSVVAEQLVRLGVRDLTLVDPDALSESNLTRVYGSVSGDVGRPKVEVLGGHLAAIAPKLRTTRIKGSVVTESVAKQLTQCDVVFGCTDDNAGRLVLSRAATYLLVPVIDSGVLITSDRRGNVEGIHARVTVLTPGQACLVCRGRVDLTRAAAELLTPDERLRREDEGYAPALGAVEAAVVAFTTTVGALAVSELLERLIGYGPEPRPSEILFRCHDREMSTNSLLPRERHYCNPASGKTGAGSALPFLEQTWPS